jgi:Fic family protein
MEPMLPSEEGHRDLEELAHDLTLKAGRLGGSVSPVVQRGIGDLVRSMNCYYSNLIEGHNTHPRDIDRAMVGDYEHEPEKRNLQLEAVAHIEVQRWIDSGEDRQFGVIVSRDYLKHLHREFCSRLPAELLQVRMERTGEEIPVVPGEFRDREVEVGRHIPPRPESLDRFVARFEEAYAEDRLTRPRQLVAVAASHHRLAWIHPFLDGNGRVGRLFAHAWLTRLEIGSSLWSVSRGLARTVTRYKALLQAADEPRRGDRDGRGTLSEQALTDFCRYFLEQCVDQVEYMDQLLKPATFLDRLQAWCEREQRETKLPKGSYRILREAFVAGEFQRSQAMELTGFQDRKAREVLYELMRRGLLQSEEPRGKLRLAFPIDAAEHWFPGLYPEAGRI